MNTSPLLEASDLQGPALASGERVFKDVAVRVDAGELVLVSGPSGSGKSTFLRALAMLRPECSGEVRLRGVPQAGDHLPAYRRTVSYVAQTAPRFEGTVEESLRMAFGFGVATHSFDGGQAHELCEALRLPKDVLDRELTSLSGGEGLRISLVRSLLTRPSVLLLDEPTSALDDASAASVREVLAHWLTDGEHAAIIVTHDAADFVSLATRQLRLSGGQLQAVS